jgi:hypothetical protein
MSTLNAIQFSAVDGTKGLSQEMVLDHYHLYKALEHVTNLMPLAFKSVMDSLTNVENDEYDPYYQEYVCPNNIQRKYTSYYTHHTFTVLVVSYTATFTNQMPLTVYFSIKANSEEETPETLRELIAIYKRAFKRLTKTLHSHGKEYYQQYLSTL